LNLRRVSSRALIPLGLLAALVAVGLVALSQSASALPPAGIDTLNVTGEVSVTSRLGSETIPVTGSFQVDRDEPQIDGDTGMEFVTLEITDMNLQGQSVTGPLTISDHPFEISTGEIRSLELPPTQFPADSFFDIFVEANIPASPQDEISVRNDVAIRLVPVEGNSVVAIDEWPPVGVTYEALLKECLPLFPELPAEICVDDVVITISGAKTPTPSPTPCPDCTPTPPASPTNTFTPTNTMASPTPTFTPTEPLVPEDPSFSTAPGGPSGAHPADILGLGQTVPVPTGNDDFANAFQITQFPFNGTQNTTGATTEDGENLNPAGCIIFEPNQKGATVWFEFTVPSNGQVNLSTAGSNYDTVLALYTGNTLATLAVVGCDDDSGPGTQSEMSVPVQDDLTYYIQAGGFGGRSGNLVLILDFISFAGAAGGGLPGFIPCQNLGLSNDGCDSGADGDQDNLDALSFGQDFGQNDDAFLAFSVAPGSTGLAASGVAQQATCSPAQPQADEFITDADGTNALLFDGDGLNGACPTGHSLGLIEEPTSDDLDALNEQPPSAVDQLGDGTLDSEVFFSLEAGSPSLATLNRRPADVLFTDGGTPGLYASQQALGLQNGDDIDALCVEDVGAGPSYNPAFDTILFSLSANSPTLDDIGASGADVLAPGPSVRFRASDIGLRVSDDLDAMKCFGEARPDGVVGDGNCDGNVNAVDAALVLQKTAALVATLPCQGNADVNQDGVVDARDAALILQFVAGLLDQLPP